MKSRKKKLLLFAMLALSFLTACSSIVNRDGEKIWMSDTEMSELRKKEEKIALYIIKIIMKMFKKLNLMNFPREIYGKGIPLVSL